MQKSINGATLTKMVITASKLLEANRVKIDALNVFPVPDGDTGTNMSLTMQSAVKELKLCNSNRMSLITDAISRGALRGARGNSGVILSQVFRGICSVPIPVIKKTGGFCVEKYQTVVFCKQCG